MKACKIRKYTVDPTFPHLFANLSWKFANLHIFCNVLEEMLTFAPLNEK